MFDIKLKDGRYFSNVCIMDEIQNVWLEHIVTILDNSDFKMQIYHGNDDDCEETHEEITSGDIEYICPAYTYIN